MFPNTLIPFSKMYHNFKSLQKLKVIVKITPYWFSFKKKNNRCIVRQVSVQKYENNLTGEKKVDEPLIKKTN